ncbi:MAG: ABC transporter substrate-binding protein [Candidatus Methylomirabilales bacterium]
MTTGVSRRDFLRQAGGAAALAAAGSFFPARRAWGAAPPIKVGLIMSFSGVVADWGAAGRMGAFLAAEEINQAGGVLNRPLEFKLEDDISAAVAVQKARKLVFDWGADFLIGFNSSGTALAVVPILPELKRILIVPCAASPRITTEVWNKYCFRNKADSNQKGAAGAAIAATLPYTKWTVIGPDYAYGHDSWGAFATHLVQKKPGAQVMGIQAWPKFAAGAYDSHITKILDAKPEAVYCPLWGADFVTFVKQANRHDFFKKVGAFFTPAGLAMDAFYALGKEVPKGIYTASHGYWFEHPDTPRNKKWVETFVGKWGVYPHVTAHYTYSAVYYLKAAMEKAGTTDTEAVITALEGMEQQGPAYRTVIRKEDHQAITDVPWGRTKEAPELIPLETRVADIVLAKGEEIAEPIDQVLKRRKEGGTPPWMQYVIKS